MSELSRPLAADRVGPAGLSERVDATPAECAALAARMRIPAVHALSCTFRLRPLPGATLEADGTLTASVTQECVVTLDAFEQDVSERFVVRFVPEGREGDDPDPEAPDEIPYAGAVIDLGEAAAEQLALALDPYPRKPGAELPEAAPDPEEHPFAKLARRG